MQHSLELSLTMDASSMLIRTYIESEAEAVTVDMIPNEILEHIFGNLNEVQHLASVSLTNQQFYLCSKKRFEQLHKAIEMQEIQKFVHEKLPKIMTLAISRNKDIKAVNEFEMVTPTNHEEMQSKEDKEISIEEDDEFVLISKTSIDGDNQFTMQQRGRLLASTVGQFSYTYFGNIKGVALVGGSILATATGTLPLFVAALPALLYNAECLDICYDMALEKDTNFSNWIMPLMYKYIGDDAPIDSDLRMVYENYRLIGKFCRSIEELNLASFKEVITMVKSVDSFLELMKQICPRLKKFILPTETQDTELARLMEKYPSFEFVIAEESGEKEL